MRAAGFGRPGRVRAAIPNRRRPGQLVLRRRGLQRRERSSTTGVSNRTGTQTRPELPVDRASRTSQPGEHAFFSVGSDGGPRYRVLATRAGRRATARSSSPRRANDVDDAIRRLVTVEVLATARDRRGPRARHVLGDPARRAPDQADDRDRDRASQAVTSPHRVPEATAGTEAGELGVALNQMLGRIEEAFDERTRSEDRLRRFVGDASHELRTPVTTIRGYAELYRAGGLDDDDELREAMRRTEQEAIRMGRLVDDLLLLARLDQGRPLERAPVHARSARRGRGARRARGRPGPRDHRVDRAPRHACSATTGGCARSSPTSSGTRSCTRRRARRCDVRVDRTDGRPRSSRCTTTGPACPTRSRRRRSSASTAPIRRASRSRRRQRTRARDRRGDRARARRRRRARHRTRARHDGAHRASRRAQRRRARLGLTRTALQRVHCRPTITAAVRHGRLRGEPWLHLHARCDASPCSLGWPCSCPGACEPTSSTSPATRRTVATTARPGRVRRRTTSSAT